MKITKFQRPEKEHGLVGTWHLFWMEMWDEKYFNREVQAYFEIRADGTGNFQFGLVTGYFDGDVEEDDFGRQRFVYTWEGQYEMDRASGRGWLRLKDNDEAVGLITFHMGGQSKLRVRRAG